MAVAATWKKVSGVRVLGCPSACTRPNVDMCDKIEYYLLMSSSLHHALVNICVTVKP